MFSVNGQETRLSFSITSTQTRTPTLLAAIDFGALRGECEETVVSHVRKLSPIVEQRIIWHKTFLQGFVDQWFQGEDREKYPGLPADFEAMCEAGYELPRRFWLLLAQFCCLPKMVHTKDDVARTGGKVSDRGVRREHDEVAQSLTPALAVSRAAGTSTNRSSYGRGAYLDVHLGPQPDASQHEGCLGHLEGLTRPHQQQGDRRQVRAQA